MSTNNTGIKFPDNLQAIKKTILSYIPKDRDGYSGYWSDVQIASDAVDLIYREGFIDGLRGMPQKLVEPPASDKNNTEL